MVSLNFLESRTISNDSDLRQRYTIPFPYQRVATASLARGPVVAPCCMYYVR